MEARKIKGYGWIPQLPDQRDFMYSPENVDKSAVPTVLPTQADLRPQSPEPYDQGKLGSCTANGISYLVQFDLQKQNLPVIIPSRLFIYYNERVMEDTVKQDAGAQIRDGIKSISIYGVCAEKTWPYEINKFASKPVKAAFTEALSTTALTYYSLDNTMLNQLKACIAAGFPITFGFTVYESFESDNVAKSGIVPMPQNTERSLGGHCVAIAGYDDTQQWYICRNSWGSTWGDKGYFYMPYEYVHSKSLSSDFWTIRSVK